MASGRLRVRLGWRDGMVIMVGAARNGVIGWAGVWWGLGWVRDGLGARTGMGMCDVVCRCVCVCLEGR